MTGVQTCALPIYSEILFLHPEFVDPSYKNAPSLTAKDMRDLFGIAAAKDWPGYFGAPRLTTAALGANHLASLVSAESDLVIKILDGFDYRTIPHLSDQFDPQTIPPLAAELDHDHQWRDKELNWLKSHSDKTKKSSEQPK